MYYVAVTYRRGMFHVRYSAWESNLTCEMNIESMSATSILPAKREHANAGEYQGHS